jgi:ABC-type glycerol-3-phosphate transport system substrate-binding protein
MILSLQGDIAVKTPNSIILMFFVFIFVFIGCSEHEHTFSRPAHETETPAVETGMRSNSQKPVKIKWYWNESNVQLPEDGYICKRIKQDLNIEYIHISPKGTDFEEKLELMFSSGDIPDIITSYNTLTSNLIKWGVIRPIEQYLTREYIPNVIRIQNNWDMAVKGLQRDDGHIYAVPNCNDSLTAEVPFIRYDWLENLDLEVPETFDELLDVLIRFTHDDPDQNGIDDTIGTMANEFWGMVPYALNFASDHFEWYDDGEGGVTLGMFLPRHKEYLRYVKSLIDSGAMDKNIATTKFIEINDRMKTGKVGFLYQWFSHGDEEEIRKTDPLCDWRPMPPPRGVYDKGYMPSTGILREEHCISKQCKNVEAAFRLMNYMADDKSTGDKIDFTGSYWTMKYGEKGVNWDVTPEGYFDDGKAGIFPQIAVNNEDADWVSLAGRFCNRYNTAWRNSLPLKYQRMYEEIDSYPLKINIPENDPKKPYNTEFVAIPDDVAAFLLHWQYEEWPDFFYGVILGKIDIDQGFYEFVKKAKAAGLTEINRKMEEAIRKSGISRN